jgi:signal peptidase I
LSEPRRVEQEESKPGDGPAASRVPHKGVLREYVETIVVAVLFLLFARTFVFMQSKIPTESMLDTLLVGDYILVNRFVYGAPGDQPAGWLGQRPIERGDVVVFRFPEDPDVDFVKRVIGLPGDQVQMIRGVVSVNGQPLEEPYVRPENREAMQSYGPVTVPADSYFALGDNRDNSRDSRAWGFVPRSLVKGRAFLIWFSYKEDQNDHLRTGVDRLISMARKAVNPGRIRPERIFSRIE